MSNAEPRADMLPENHPALSPGMDAASSAAQPSPWPLAAAAVVMFLASLLMGWVIPINDDDVYYLHSWWLYAHGYVPNREVSDFGFVGVWILLAPLMWLEWSPGGLILFGRALVAASFGLSFWLVGRLVRAKGWEAVLLGLLGFVAMVWGEAFLFRRVYFELLFVVLHLGFLDKAARSAKPGVASALAGLCVGTACMISQRGFYYLPIQPAAIGWVFWGQRRKMAEGFVGWLAGLAAACAPTAVYLTYHQAWTEQWQWTVVFPASLPYVAAKPAEALRNYWGWLGWAALPALWWTGRLPQTSKKVLTLGWAGSYMAVLVNQFPTHYGYITMHLVSVGLITLSVQTLLQAWLRGGKLYWSIVGLLLVGAAAFAWQRTFGHIWPYPILPEQYRIRSQQVQVLDWLAELAQKEPVLAIDPYHPIVAPNATFLRGSWQYLRLLEHPWFQAKLADFANQLRQAQPPVITAQPWPDNTRQQDMLHWLANHQVLTPTEHDQLRQWIGQHYVEVQFPGIRSARFPSGVFTPGDRFWIRRDRFAACPPPDIPYQVQTPSFRKTDNSLRNEHPEHVPPKS